MLKTYTKKLDYSYAVGVYPTLELLRNRSKEIEKIILDERGNKNVGLDEIVECCRKEEINTETNRTLVHKLAKSENAYCLGVFKKYRRDVETAQNHVVLVNPSDMGNLGTIIRTMLAFDTVNLALVKPACDIFDPKVIRASMGALFKLNFEYFASFVDYKNRFSNNIYTLRTNGGTDIDTCRFEKPFSLVFGNEGAGLPPEYDDIGRGIKIPQSKNVDSLNLAIAVGVALHHSYSQKE